ncbi:MAG: UDP-N-acetylmuramoyl-L-alanine--D-glutamate ligase [Armatimonadota bacterium]|nr:UDP-N-acetylmuramoyl-L-alanine--D-glutamate ligase [Armatimonadota bacterium]
MAEQMNRISWKGKHILVVGIGRSGYDVARVLRTLDARVTACDKRNPPLAAELEQIGVHVMTKWQEGMPVGDYDLVVTSPGVPADAPILQQAVQQGIPVWSEVEFAFHLAQAPIVAVTGTNGKSTTAALIVHILSTAGYDAVLCGNIAAEEMERTLTDAAFHSHERQILVAEVSSFQLEWVHQFRPHVGVWTTLSPDHLDRHRSFEEYGRTKARLFLRQQEDDFAVLPSDDALIQSLVSTRAQLLYFSHQKVNKNVETAVWCNESGVYLRRWGEERHLASIERLRLYGLHNWRNVAAAVAACSPWEVPPERLQEAVDTFRPLPHRMEWVAEIAGVHYVNNSMCTNLQAVQESLQAAPAPVVLIMGGVDKSDSPFQNLVPLLQEKARGVVLIGADAERIEQQLRTGGWVKTVRCGTLEEAVRYARDIAQRGDWVMLSPGCASFDMFASFQERGKAFRQIVHRLEALDE